MNTLTDKQIEEIQIGSKKAVEMNKKRQQTGRNAYKHNKIPSAIRGAIAEYSFYNLLIKEGIPKDEIKFEARHFTNKGSDIQIRDQIFEIKANAWHMLAPAHKEKYKRNNAIVVWYDIVYRGNIKTATVKLLGWNDIHDLDRLKTKVLKADDLCPTPENPSRKTCANNIWLYEEEKTGGRPISILIKLIKNKLGIVEEKQFEKVQLI
tara:strand:- start:369 stop:989 length:621 start_codon:yes stop_codon:yes gene_type:complete